MIAVFGSILLGMVLWQASAPPDIAGKWAGEEWGTVVLEAEQPGWYEGSYTDSEHTISGTMRLKWSRFERRFNGTWREGEDRFGELSLRLVGKEIRGARTIDPSSEVDAATPRLTDLLWARTVATPRNKAATPPQATFGPVKEQEQMLAKVMVEDKDEPEADRRDHVNEVGGLRFRRPKFERAAEGFLEADLGTDDGYVAISFRLFDHATDKMLHDSQWQQTNPDACQFHVERIGASSRIRMKEAGGRFPEKIDLLLRIATTDRGETIVLPAVDGAAARHDGSEIVVTSLLEGRLRGKSGPGGPMIWDRSSAHDKERVTTVNFENRGNLLLGDFHFVGVKKDGTRHPMDDRHFLNFKMHLRHAYVMLDVSREDLDHLELVPIKSRYRFGFNGVEVPGRVLPELSAEQRREVKRLVERGVGARDDAEQNEIVQALVGMGPGVAPEMIPLLRSGGSDVVGMRVLKKLAADAVVQDLLVRAVGEARDRHPNVVHCGLLALGGSDNRKHADFIAGFLPTSGIAAIGALRELGGDQARDHLIAAFETVPPERWSLVAGALQDLGDPAAVPELKRRLAQVDVPPGDDFPVAMVSAMTEAIASLSGREIPGLHSFGQGQHFRYPFDGPGAPKTFSVAPPQDHYASLPKVDPDTTEGRTAIWRALEEITKGPGFTIDGDEIVLFNGLRAAPLWPDGRPYPTTLYDWLRRTSHQEILQVVRQGDRGTRQPIPLNSPLAALDPKGNLYVLVLKQTAPDFVYEVSIEPLDPSRQLVRPRTDPQSLVFTEWSGCTLHDLESGQKDGCLNLSRGHMDTLTEERWRTELTDALLSVDFASGGMALAVGGAEDFRLVQVGQEAAGDSQQVVRRLRQASATDPEDGHEVIDDDGGIFHVLPEGAEGRTYAFAVAMPLGLPVAGVIEIGEADHKAETLRIRQRFLTTRAARGVFGIEEEAAVIENHELSIIDTSGNPIAGARVKFAKHRLVQGKHVIAGEAVSGADGKVAIPGDALRNNAIRQLIVHVEADGYVSRSPSHDHLMERDAKGEWYTGVSDGVAFRSMVLLKGGTITGRMLGPDGRPLAGAPLSITTNCDYEDYWRGSGPSPNNHGYFVANHLRAISDENGEFRFDGVPAGNLLIYYPWEGPIQGEIDSGRWKPWTKPGQQYPQPPVADRAWGKTIRLTEGESRGDIVVDLSKSSARIDGQVVDAAGQPVAGPLVRAVAKLENDTILSWPDSFGGGHDTTDADGRFRLRGLPPGTISLNVNHATLKAPKDPVEIKTKAGEVVRAKISMIGAPTANQRPQIEIDQARPLIDVTTGTLGGRLLDRNGRPVAWATVVLCDMETGIPLHRKTFKPFTEGEPDLEGLAVAATDDAGRFQFDGVPHGTYRLLAQSWPAKNGVTKVFEENGSEIVLRGVADDIQVPSEEAENILIRPLGDGVVTLDEDFPNSDALMVVSTQPLAYEPILGFASWRGTFLQGMIGANRMPKGFTRISGLPEGEIHLSVFANDNNGGIGAGSVISKDGETVQAEFIPIVCGWSNGRHDPPANLMPTFRELQKIAAERDGQIEGFLGELLRNEGVAIPAVENQRKAAYFAHLDQTVALRSGRKVRFADVLASALYHDLRRAGPDGGDSSDP